MTLYLFPLLALAALVVSAAKDRGRTKRAVGAAAKAGLNLLPSLLGLTAGVALSLAALPPRAIAQLFQSHGAAGFFLLAGVGALLVWIGLIVGKAPNKLPIWLLGLGLVSFVAYFGLVTLLPLLL